MTYRISFAVVLYAMRSSSCAQIFRNLALSTEGPIAELEKVGRTGDDKRRERDDCGAWRPVPWRKELEKAIDIMNATSRDHDVGVTIQ